MSKKNNLDELQEIRLLHIERNGCWFAFWGLLVAMVVQLFLAEGNFWQIAGEWIVFMMLAVYLCIDCIRNGIWSRHYRADGKTNLKFSLVGAFAAAVIMGGLNFYQNRVVLYAVVAAFIYFCFLFVVLFLSLTFASNVYKKRLSDLENRE